ncbi:uncharacterized protein LOC113496153 [Trichoplusia ni]|uniref:Uncharacterized protein LOC113494913 n=1 Tax=Trichoplusia ni TaxID=7111 RepID=A0A7E5VLM6_TRINI|nr:uncharacterized protein LOC113494913 [Trichoplusia ni]XP_026731084.1 uncharacterized protein LOC113496153 [Trichoplusia ni]
MAITLQSLYNELKEIRTYLIKIGPKRRQGHILESKLSEANIVHEQFECWLNTYKSKLRKDDDDDPVVHSFCKQFLTLFNEIVDLCQSDKNSEDFVTMSTFDLKTALNLLPCMTDTEANTKQLIDNIEYYNSLLDKDVCKKNLINFVLKSRLSQAAKLRLNSSYASVDDLITDMRKELLPRKSATAISSKLEHIKQNDLSISDFGNQLSELFVDLTISQANGKSENYSILKPLNENIAIKKFADGLRDRRLSTIIAARNFSTLKDAIQAAMDEEVTTASGSGEIMEDKDEVFEEISEDGISRSRPEVHRREDIGSAVNNIEVSPQENKGYVNNLMLTL